MTQTSQSAEIQRRVQTIEGIEQSIVKATPNSAEAAGALQKMQTELAAENATKKSDPTISSAVAKQLQSDGFMITVDKDGDLIYSPQPNDDRSPITAPSAASVRKPEESDFVKFAQMLPEIPAGAEVDAKNFASVFGPQDAAILQSLGLQSISNSSNGQYEAEFANSGTIPFGPNSLDFSKSVSFDWSSTSAGIQLDKIKGLKGKEGSLNPTLSRIAIAPEDMQTKQWNVNVTGKELMMSGTELEVVKDQSAPNS